VLRFTLLGSGSSGNAALVTAPDAKILIDCGLSLKQLRSRAELVGESLDGLQAVFITHEHGDHVLSLPALLRQFPVPVYMTPGTHENLPARLAKLPYVHAIEPGETVAVGAMEVDSFPISHDAAEPVSYAVRAGGAKVGFATDLGHVSHGVRRCLAGANALVLESNYCPIRLRNGHYPAQVQHRIRSRQGHLSNQDMCGLLGDLVHAALRTVVLMHISENNNHPGDVLKLVRGVLRTHPAHVHLALQDEPTPVFEVVP
jgi:phosphoribosyl 1,2-cyclic phosphodiesterase